MKESTRKWLEDLATIKNNSKAIEIVEYIEKLELDLSGFTKENIEWGHTLRKSKEVDVSDIGLIGL